MKRSRPPCSRWLLTAALFAVGAPAHALEFVVDRSDGAVYLRNADPFPSTIDAYTLLSPGEALVVGGWTPIAGNYDLSGDQSVDETADWFVINGDSSNVAEASLIEGSAALDAGQVVSLGLFFDTELIEGLIATTAADGLVSDPFPAFFRDLGADYNGDLDVDIDDYQVFAETFGSTDDLRADGNGDGVIDAADYTVWRDSPALVVTPDPAFLAFAIPEPGAGSIAFVAMAISSARRRGRRAAW